MKTFLFFSTLFLLYSCNQTNSNKVIKELSHSNDDSIVLNKWIENITKTNPKISSKTIDSAQLGNIKDCYSKLPTDSFKTLIEYDLSNKIPKISVVNNVITLDYPTNDIVTFFILKDKFIYSYHHIEGNNGHSVIYDLKKQKDTLFPFIENIANNIATIQIQKYSTDKKTEGTPFLKNGEWNIITNQIKWGEWEQY